MVNQIPSLIENGLVFSEIKLADEQVDTTTNVEFFYGKV
jgi:hypothetical protein